MIKFFRIPTFLFVSLFLIPAYATVHDYLESIKSNPNALYSFFKSMPKGGELHYHLAGGAYPEHMLALAANHEYCLNQQNHVLSKPVEPCNGIESRTLFTKPEIYNQTIEAWSMKNFVPGKESAHDHFFASFYKFMPVVADFRPQLLAEIMERAANQNELYLEIMVLPDNASSSKFANVIADTSDWDKKHKLLLANQGFQHTIQHTIEESNRILKEAHRHLGCAKSPDAKACSVTIKFQYYILREQPIDNLFAQAANAFVAASKSPDIVGINLVQAEDGLISLRDYRKHMQIIAFLHKLYPDVHIALHAGELSPDAVMPNDLRFHIYDAVYTGHAERIGHGVDIAYEDKAEELLKFMAAKPVPVEINLTSNQIILNVSGKKHPLRYYLAHDVPVVLSTDDEGVLRTDLTRQYVEAVYLHGLNYDDIKTINRNALTYSFLPGVSIWADDKKQIPVPACQTLNSISCQKFIKTSQKAQLQWQLEQNLNQFERLFSN